MTISNLTRRRVLSYLVLSLFLFFGYATGLSTRQLAQNPQNNGKRKSPPRRSKQEEMYSPCNTKVRAAEVLVKFSQTLTDSTMQIFEKQVAAGRSFRLEQVGNGNTLYLIHVDGMKVSELVTAFNALKRQRSKVMIDEGIVVQYVEPNFIFDQDSAPIVLQPGNVPNDLELSQQWGLRDSRPNYGGISAVSAWQVSQGSRDIVVGVVDTGVSYLHPDLVNNIWPAPRDFSVQVAGQLIPCLANTHGFDALSKTCNPIERESHGTRVSGIIGSEGDNGKGIVGVNWKTRIMGLAWDDGKGNNQALVNAISFAVEVKKQGDLADIRVLNNSYGYYTVPDPECRPKSLIAIIEEANDCGILFVASAGDKPLNTDQTPHYPSGLGLLNIISVAATAKNDTLYSASSHGQTSIDLGAPGARIKSTGASNDYPFGGGTSFAAPFVSGAAALILSKPGSPCVNLTPVELKECILKTADEVPSLMTQLPRGRRLNVDRAIRECEKYVH